MRLNKLTNHALIVLSTFPSATHLMSARELSDKTGVPLPTVNKILKSLGKKGIVTSRRGANGGYRLSREPGNITVADIIGAMEGPITLRDCAADSSGCTVAALCPTRDTWNLINRSVVRALEAVTLDDLVSPACTEKPTQLTSADAPTNEASTHQQERSRP